jgi:hypothetical protein
LKLILTHRGAHRRKSIFLQRGDPIFAFCPGDIWKKFIKDEFQISVDFQVNGAFDERKMPEGGVTLVGFEL